MDFFKRIQTLLCDRHPLPCILYMYFLLCTHTYVIVFMALAVLLGC